MSRQKDQTEVVSDVFNRVPAMLEKQIKRNILDYPRFVYRYVKKEAYIFLRVCDRHGNQFISRLEPDSPGVIDDEILLHQICWDRKTCVDALQGDRHTLVRTEAAHNVGHSESNKQSMLVNVVQLIQDPEINIPILVWSCPVDDVRYELPAASYFSSLSGVIFIDGIVDWKSGDALLRSAPIYLNQVPDEVVERTPEGIECFPRDDTHFGTNGWLPRDIVGDIPGFLISLSSDTVAAFLSERNEQGFKLS